jgi:hypothetical protein
MERFKPYGKVEIIHEHGQPRGIRDKGGYLLFFNKVHKYPGQEERYVKEIKEKFILAETIKNALTEANNE